MIHLLNAAVMPQEGRYEIRVITPAQFAAEVRTAWVDTEVEIKHYIGYQNTLDMLETLLGVSLGRLNVEQTELTDGDTFYVARLQRRVSPAAKRVATRNDADQLEISDFDFFKGRYNDLTYTGD